MGDTGMLVASREPVDLISAPNPTGKLLASAKADP